MRLLFDIETDGLLDDVSKIHCIVAADLDTKVLYRFGPDDIAKGVALLYQADFLAGHNIVEYDLPVLKRLVGFEPTAVSILDTLCASRQAHPGKTLNKTDWPKHQRGELAKELIGRHSLAAWGQRLGYEKGTPPTDHAVYTPATLEYCERDVLLNVILLDELLKRQPEAVYITETAVAAILFEQTLHGISFDEDRAIALMTQLAQRKADLAVELRSVFKPWFEQGDTVVPKRSQVSRVCAPGEDGYKNVAKDAAYTKIELTEFNPASGAHIANRLQALYGWKPKNYTDAGTVQTGEDILEDLPYPECRPIVEYQRVKKILGYVSEGTGSWLALAKRGRIHGRVLATGANTNRMSHSSPNLAQVPKADTELGKECRALFRASPGMVLVGCDAQGIQLRVLAHYLAKYDGGAFARVVESGDPHTYMQSESRLYSRGSMKTVNYAWIFGAGDYKLGLTWIADRAAKGEKVPLSASAKFGKRLRTNMEAKLNMDAMRQQLRLSAKRGSLRSLDGRSVPVLSEHRALCTLLQAGEAVIMKHALILARKELAYMDGNFVLNVHDEWQYECPAFAAEEVGRALADCIVQTGINLKLRVQLAAEYKIGANWAETH